MQQNWVIAPCDFECDPVTWQRVWQFNLQHNFISIGWGALKNVSRLSDAAIRERHEQTWPTEKSHTAIAASKVLYKFWHDINIGDKVVARRGRKSISAIGTVVSAPYYEPNKARKVFEAGPARSHRIAFPNHIDVEWLEDCRDLEFDRLIFGFQTLHSIAPERLDELLQSHAVHALRLYPDDIADPDDTTGPQEYIEGGRKTVMVNAYERSAKGRAACLKEHGYSCTVCMMSFVEMYGKVGVNFIHVHHTNPIAARRKRYKLNPKTDLIPVCPNCHAMLHASNPPLTVNRLRRIVARLRKTQ